MTTKRAKFDVYRSRDGKIVAVGEAYTREASARRSLRAVEASAVEAMRPEAKLVPTSEVSAILRSRLEAADHG